jgi:hypothetical protein
MNNSNDKKVQSNSKSGPKPKGQNKYKSKEQTKSKPVSKNKSKSKRNNVLFNLTNADRKQKNFMYQNLTQAKCYMCNFSDSNFDYVSFRGASMKSCKFTGCSFKSSEFIGTNLKESNFSNAKFENVVFESAKLADVNFKDATFVNTVFLSTDTEDAKNLDLNDENIKVYEEMPVIEISEALKVAVETAMSNQFVKKARVLDTRKGEINYLSLMILLEHFDEEILIKGLSSMEPHIDRDFYTLSFIISLIEKLKKLQ